jgi:hypothetical protein
MAFFVSIVCAAIIGAGSTYFGAGVNDAKAVAGGAFLCIVASHISFTALQWILAYLYQRNKAIFWKRLYYFLTPRPLKSDDDEPPQDGDLTRMFEDKTGPRG